MKNKKHPSQHLLSKHTINSQKGAILIQFALLATMIISILGTIQIGYMYYAKRDFQRIADIAAMEATNALTYGNQKTCESAEKIGLKSIKSQWPALELAKPSMQIVQCGSWDSTISTVTKNGPDDLGKRFRSGGSDGPVNAVRVQLKGETLKLVPFISSSEVYAEAIAAKANEPIAAFSVGSQLLRFENGALLGRVLQNIGLNIQDLRILDSDGLASASITPSGLLQAIGKLLNINDLIILDLAALTPSGIAKIPDITIADIIQASASLVESQTANILLNVANVIRANPQIGSVKIPLIGTSDKDGVFSFVGLGSSNSPIGAAADIRLNVADIAKTALALGVDGRHALTLGLSLLDETISMKLMIVEPPSIGIGPVGTKAYNAQVRLNLDVDTDELPGLGKLLTDTLLRLDLPLAVDLTSAEGTLQEISCNTSPPTVEILIDSHIGDICIGHIGTNNIGRCSNSLTPTNALDLNLIIIPLVEVSIKSYVPLLPAKLEIMKNFSEHENPRRTASNAPQVGSTVNQLLKNLEVDARLLGSIPLDFLVENVKFILTPILTKILIPADGLMAFLVSPLLKDILGIEIGRTTVDVISIQCDTAQLVN